MAQKVYRKNKLDELKRFLETVGHENVFLVRGDRSYGASGAEQFIGEMLGKTDVGSFHNFDPNPQLDDLETGVALFRKGHYQLILAIGGGSVLDMAKLISIFAHQSAGIKNIITGSATAEGRKTPVIAIPTTAGTGAEATKFAVLYIDKKKYSFEHPQILPDHVYLSPEFLRSASPYLTACAGLDALCQAIESAWSVNATGASLELALKAVSLVWNNLQKAVNHNDINAMEQMLEAAHLSGRAINITKTTAPHALSYAYTSYYGIPHGHAVALSLPFFLGFNHAVSDNNCTDARGAGSVRERIEKVLGVMDADIQKAPTMLEDFFSSIGVHMDIASLTDTFDPNIIIDHVNTERLTNNPRAVTKSDLRTLLRVQPI
ncbi:MAG: phosphonoacetaldehyde reductase [Bacteroidales bacterium]|nr:phosphonoacetaldehyde reductase [Bacteroidales bacterium]